MFAPRCGQIKRNAIGRALRERDPCYAASTFLISKILCEQRQQQQRREAPLLKRMYIHRVGRYSLTEDDPAWEALEEPDHTGFRGLTSSTIVICSREPRNFCDKGFRVRVQMPAGRIEYRLTPSDVVQLTPRRTQTCSGFMLESCCRTKTRPPCEVRGS